MNETGRPARPERGEPPTPERDLAIAAAGLAAATVMINLLGLTGPLFALEVYDRVLPARSAATLVAFAGLAVIFYAALAALEYLRGQLIARAGLAAASTFDEKTRHRFAALAQSPAPAHLLDLAWSPVYVALAWVLHPALGAATALAGAALAGVTLVLTRRRTRAMRSGATALPPDAIPTIIRSEALSRARREEADANEHAALAAADRAHALAAATKLVRLLAQSGALGVSALLALHDAISVGSIMAMSVITARALQPIDSVIANWPALAWGLGRLIARKEASVSALVPCPRPAMPGERGLVVDRLQAAHGLGFVSFKLRPGDALGLVGTSGTGKSRLLDAIAGLRPPANGDIRLDGIALSSLDPATREQRIGYLPQTPQFMSGTLRDAITRFDPAPSDARLLEAAHRARLDAAIARLPHGFETGLDAAAFSPGFRQRLALARALYGAPALVLLDEPFAHMDHEGDKAVLDAIRTLRSEGCIVLIVAHRLSALAAVDLVLAMKDGRQQIFGPKESVLRLLPGHEPIPRRDAS